MNEREGLRDGRETCCDIWFRNGGTNNSTGGGRTEDVKGGTALHRLLWKPFIFCSFWGH